MKPCHCDKYGVIHVFTPECEPTYSGPDKPQAMSIYGPDPIITSINELWQENLLLKLKIDNIEQKFIALEKLVLKLAKL